MGAVAGKNGRAICCCVSGDGNVMLGDEENAAFIARFDPVRVRELLLDNQRLEAWVTDLQKDKYINCVYCGHRYGPEDETPVLIADALKEHIKQCPKHPMSRLKTELEELRTRLGEE